MNSCGQTGYVFYPSTHDDYELVASMVLVALTSQREMRFYINDCVPVSFHWSGNEEVPQSVFQVWAAITVLRGDSMRPVDCSS